MLLFGGFTSSYVSTNDLWELSLASPPTWTLLAPTGTPPSERDSHSAVYDPVGDRMIVFAGKGNLNTDNDEVWALSLAGTPAWTQLAPTGTPPSTRELHQAIYDAAHDRMLVFGGSHYTTTDNFLNDVWALSLAGTPAWTQLAPIGTAPSAREACSQLYDPTRSRMLAWGGYFFDGLDHFYGDLNSLSLSGTPAWSGLGPDGPGPSARGWQSAVYDPTGGRFVLFGGTGGSSYFNDVSALLLGSGGSAGVSDPPGSMSWLRSPVPNPSFSTTTLNYSIPRAGRVQLGVYDVSGRLVRTLVDAERPAGVGVSAWDGLSDSGMRQDAGVYYVRLRAPGVRETRRAVLLR